MPAELWLPKRTIEQITSDKRVAVEYEPLREPITFIVPSISDPDELFGAHLTLSPQELERKIIETSCDHPEMLEQFNRVKIHFNQGGVNVANDSLINYFLAAFQYGEVLPCMAGEPTRLLIQNLGMTEEFKVYGVNFFLKGLAERMCNEQGRDIGKYTYQTRVLALSQK